METVVPAVPDNELIMMRPYVRSDIRARSRKFRPQPWSVFSTSSSWERRHPGCPFKWVLSAIAVALMQL